MAWADSKGYVFNTKTGDITNFADICTNSSYKDYFYNIVVNKLQEKYGDYLTDNAETGKSWKNIVKENMFNIGNWGINSTSITFYFEKYQIGIGAAGAPYIEIPYSEVNQYLKIV